MESDETVTLTKEQQRIRNKTMDDWRLWGPYLSERQWGTVREDYSADGNAWMAMFSLNLLRMSLELSRSRPLYQDLATKFFEHFLYIAGAMNHVGPDQIGLWDETDEFFYDVLHLPYVSGATGKIICISSVHQVIPWAGHVNYAASRGGVNMMIQSIAQKVDPFRIRVNNISPGAIRTPINRDAWNTPETLASLRTLIPYNRIGEVEDIGRAAIWLASDQADYITGTSLYIDGGMTLYPGFATDG